MCQFYIGTEFKKIIVITHRDSRNTERIKYAAERPAGALAVGQKAVVTARTVCVVEKSDFGVVERGESIKPRLDIEIVELAKRGCRFLTHHPFVLSKR